MQALPKAVSQWNELIAQASSKYNIPAQLIAGVMATESGGKQKVLSPVNAAGLMQLLPSTASDQAKRTVTANELLKDPALNVDLGVRYMRELWDRYKGNPIKIAAGYNAGSVKCGAPGKCPDGPNQWNVITDCADGKAVDYPMRMFAYSNAALSAGVGTSTAPRAGSGGGAGWLVAGLVAAAALAVTWRSRA